MIRKPKSLKLSPGTFKLWVSPLWIELNKPTKLRASKGLYFFALFFEAVDHFLPEAWFTGGLSTTRLRDFKPQPFFTASPTVLIYPEKLSTETEPPTRTLSQTESSYKSRLYVTETHLSPVIVAFLNFSGTVPSENIWWIFRVKLPISNFSGASVNGASLFLQSLIGGRQFARFLVGWWMTI